VRTRLPRRVQRKAPDADPSDASTPAGGEPAWAKVALIPEEGVDEREAEGSNVHSGPDEIFIAGCAVIEVSAMCAASTASRRRCISSGGTGCSRGGKAARGSQPGMAGAPAEREPYAHGPIDSSHLASGSDGMFGCSLGRRGRRLQVRARRTMPGAHLARRRPGVSRRAPEQTPATPLGQR
jgi:hypothetical protein